MITNESRYVDGRLRTVEDKVGVTRNFPVQRSAYRLHTWSQADRLDVLAARHFGDAKQWWRIMDMNPTILGPRDLRPGMRIRVPNA